MALESCDEVKVGLSFAKDPGYLAPGDSDAMVSRFDVRRMLYGLHRS